MAGIQIDGVNNKIDFDDDADTSISSATDDTLVFEAGGTNIMSLTATTASINDGLTVSVSDESDALTVVSTDTGANNAPFLKMYRNSSSPADNDYVGLIKYVMRNDNSEDFISAQHYAYTQDVSDGTEDGGFALDVMKAGTVSSILTATASEICFNNGSKDIDFRVESDGDTNCLTVDAGLDTVIMGSSSEYSGTGAKLTVTPQIDVGDTSLTGTSAVHFIRAASTGVIGGIYGKWSGYGEGGYIKFKADNVGGGAQTASIVFGTNVNNSQADRFNIAGNGDLTATDTSISSISDERLKENITDFNYDISKFKQLKPRSYKWKNPIYHGNKVDENGDALTSYGTIAQEVAAVDADFVRDFEIKDEVNSDKDLLDADNVSKTTTITGKEHAMYISVIQQLITRIEALEGN